MAAEPDLIVALDTEYARHRDGEDHGELPEAEQARRNHVLCYAAMLLDPATGRGASGIIPTEGPEHRRRLHLGGLLARLLVAARAAGVIGEIPGRMRLVLVMHFSRADLPGFRDFPRLKRLVDSIRGTYASSERPLICDVRLPSGRRVRCSVTVRDTLLLAPAGFGSLAALGEACGIAKLRLGGLADGTPAIEAMDRLRAEDPALFERYALRDAEVAMAWYGRVAAFMREQLGLPVPPVTIGSAAVRLFRLTLERDGLDPHALLGQRVVREGRQRRVEWLPAYGDIRPLAESCYHGAANYAAVAGFMPEGRWTDVDIVSAYTTCMAAIRLPDWQGVTETRDPERLADLDAGIAVARVRFRFPDGCRFPSLPVRAGANGLLFPLEGTSCCTGPEIRLALDQGAEIAVERGAIVPWLPGSPRPFAAFTRHIGALRRSQPKGSAFELLAKEAGNSLYGKLAQGIYPEGAEARDGGLVPGRAAGGKRVFNSRRGTLERIPPSRLTQALLAAYVTGLCRAVLGELAARLPAGVTLATATTDGLLVDCGLDRIDTSGPVTRFFSSLREMLTGDPTVLEVKHEAGHILVFRTRGTVSVAPGPQGCAGKPILARAGQRLETPPDPDAMPGGTPEARKLAAGWAEAEAWVEIYREREHGTRHHRRYLIAPRRQWLSDGDLVEDPREVRLALDYDLKRMPVRVGEREGCLCVEATRPWRDRAEFRAWRDDLDLWRDRHRRVLKTLADWRGFCAWRERQDRHRVARRGAAGMSPFVRALLAAWARGEAGLPRDRARGKPAAGSWTTTRIASALAALTGQPVTARMVEKAAGKAVVPAGGLTERDLEIASELRRTAPGVRLQDLTVGSAAAALAAGMADAAGKPPPEALVGYSPEHATSRKPAWLLGFQRPRILTPPSL